MLWRATRDVEKPAWQSVLQQTPGEEWKGPHSCGRVNGTTEGYPGKWDGPTFNECCPRKAFRRFIDVKLLSKNELKIILSKKGKHTVKYLFNKNSFIIYTELNKKYNKLFSLLHKSAQYNQHIGFSILQIWPHSKMWTYSWFRQVRRVRLGATNCRLNSKEMLLW